MTIAFKTTLDRFAMWDERFREEGYAYGVRPNDFLLASAPFLSPGGNVLCLAAGEGRNAVYLAEMGHGVVAVDGSSVGLAKAANLARHRSVVVQTVLADLAHYEIPPLHFNGIVSIFCHLLPDIRARLHAQIYKGLQPGGIFILEGFAKGQVNFDSGGPKDPEMLMDLKTVLGELEPLKIRFAEELERDVLEGKYHTGKAAVIQIIGIRE